MDPQLLITTPEVNWASDLPPDVLISDNSSNTTNCANLLLNTFVAGLKRDEELVKIELIVLALLFTLTVLGNGTVLLGIFSRKKRMTRMYYFIFHLSIADMLTAFFNTLAQLVWELTYRFRGGNFLCKAVKYTQILGPYSSSYVLVMTAIDRYQAVCYPLGHRPGTTKTSKFMLAAAWTISFLCCVPQLFIFSYQIVDASRQEFDCLATFPDVWVAKFYVTWYSVTVFVIPLLILIYAYTQIVKAICYNCSLKKEYENQDIYEMTLNNRTASDDEEMEQVEKVCKSQGKSSCVTKVCQVNFSPNLLRREVSTSLPMRIDKCGLSSDSRGVRRRILASSRKASVFHTFSCRPVKRSVSLTESKGSSDCDYDNRSEKIEFKVNTQLGQRNETGVTATNIESFVTRTVSKEMPLRSNSTKWISRAKIRTIKLTLTIVCTYIVCSCPFIAAQLWYVYDPDAICSPFFTGPTFTILTLLASLNSCVNPYICLCFNPNLLPHCCRVPCASRGARSSSSRQRREL